jgi:predicted transposase/invertase (TIGR01784 family)
MNTKQKKTAGEKKASQSKYDSAWKKVIEKLFKNFLEFFFPDIYQAIDFTKKIHFLDKELKEIAPDSNIGDRAADVLVKAHLKDGSLTYICIIIHIEVQSQAKPGFMERMFIYYYRAYDKMVERNIPMISVAILADENQKYRPDEYYFNLLDFEMRMKIPVVKILDYKLKEELKEKLEKTTNPMSMIVQAQLKSHELKQADNDTRFEVTKELIRQCYKHGYSKHETRLVMNFFDWVIRLPGTYKERLKKVIRKIEEEFQMEYIPLWERDARKEGEKRGEKIGEKRGEKIGEKRGKEETAKNLLKMGFEIDVISKATGLKKTEIEKLALKSH